MKCAIIYAAQHPGRDLTPVPVSTTHDIWVRAEEVDAFDLISAIDFAKPRPGETFLNSIPIKP